MLTQWIQKIISMLLVMSAVLQVIPGKDYEKYIRFFCGLVLILLAKQSNFIKGKCISNMKKK